MMLSVTRRYLSPLAELFVACFVCAVAVTTAVAQDTVTAAGRDYVETVELQGASVEGYETTELKAKLGGFVKSIGKVGDKEIDIGSRVDEGTVVAELDVPEMAEEILEKMAIVEQTESEVLQALASVKEAESQVLQKKAAVDQAKAQQAKHEALMKLNVRKFERLSQLAKRGAIGVENLDEAEYSVAAARAALASVDADIVAAETNVTAAEAKVTSTQADEAAMRSRVKVAQSSVRKLETMLKYATIRAPFPGIITRREIDHGTFVSSAQNNSTSMPLFEITRLDRVRIVVEVPNNKLEKIQVGQKCVFHNIGSLPGRSFEGAVTRSAGALHPKRRTMRIEVDFDNNAKDIDTGEEFELKPGMYGTLTATRHDWSGDNKLPVVPTSAVGKDSKGRAYVVVSGAEKTKRLVQIAFNDGVNVGVSSGLKVGERVSIKGLDQYK